MKSRSGWSWQNLLALLLLITAASLAWSKRIGGGDTFVSLAAGRDALAGKMGLPDEWSFTTENRVWMDQNWGSHTTYYVSWQLLGDTGPVAVKWLVLFGTMLLMVRAATQRGANRVFAATIISVAMLVGRSYLDVRPHIFTLLFAAALIVIFQQWYKRSSAWAFVATAVIGLWSNMHGGFVFGIAMMGLWLGVQAFFKLVWSRSRPWEWSHLIVFAVALGAAIVLAMTANPFGVENLTHPLVVEKSAIWLSVQEWHPLLDKKGRFGSVWEYKTLMWVLGSVALCWLIVGLLFAGGKSKPAPKTEPSKRSRDKRRRRHSAPEAPETNPEIYADWIARSGLFDLGLMAVTIVMAFRARRFIALSTVIVAPIMIPMIEDILRRIKRTILRDSDSEVWTPLWRMLLAGVNVGLLVAGLTLAKTWIYYPYRDPNPIYPKQTVLMRMIGSQTFPRKAMDFLTSQKDLPTNTFVDWRWEGYTRWRSDHLKTFCGGRAQQVHSERIAMWQIPTPSQGATPLVFGRARGMYVVNNGKLLMSIGRKDGVIAEVSSGRSLLGLLRAEIAVTQGGKTAVYRPDKAIGVRIHELTDYWADIDVAVVRTTEPKFRAEYRLTMLGDQPRRSQGSGFFKVRLLRLTNTGSNALQVANHSLLLSSSHENSGGPFGKAPITFWQTKNVRFGLAESSLPGSLPPRIDRSTKPPQLASSGTVGKTLNPKETVSPEKSASLVFIHRAEPMPHPSITLNTVHRAELHNCRRVVREARAHKIDIFVLPKAATGLVGLLMGSKQWACVFDDGTAYVLLNRANEKNKKLIADILAGKVEYAGEYLESLGMALTRWSMSRPHSSIVPFQEDLKKTLTLEPDFSAYWWFVQLQKIHPMARHPNNTKKNLSFWEDQWKILEKRPVPRQRAVRFYQCRQVVGQVLRNSYNQLGQKDKVAEWQERLKELEIKMKALRKKFI